MTTPKIVEPFLRYILERINNDERQSMGMMYETFKCPICKTEFPNPEKLREHRMSAHKGSRLF
jgi:hypothetical protein